MQLSDLSHNSFRKVIKDETSILRDSSSLWRKEAITNKGLSEDVIGEINVATGQSELLIQERFSQFSNLIDDSEFKRSEKEVTLQDLQGFWDIIFFQVENIKSNFEKLNKLKENNWEMPVIKVNNGVSQKRKPLSANVKPKKIASVPAGKSSIREHILAQRKKMKTDKPSGKSEAAMEVCEEKENKGPKVSTNVSPVNSGPMKRFDAGFFEVHTPVRKSSSRKCIQAVEITEISPSKLMASSALKTRVQKTPIRHKDYSPCMRITRSMKRSRMNTTSP